MRRIRCVLLVVLFGAFSGGCEAWQAPIDQEIGPDRYLELEAIQQEISLELEKSLEDDKITLSEYYQLRKAHQQHLANEIKTRLNERAKR